MLKNIQGSYIRTYILNKECRSGFHVILPGTKLKSPGENNPNPRRLRHLKNQHRDLDIYVFSLSSKQLQSRVHFIFLISTILQTYFVFFFLRKMFL